VLPLCGAQAGVRICVGALDDVAPSTVTIVKEEFFVAVARRVLAEWNRAFSAHPLAHNATDYAQAFLRTFDTLADLNENNP
jgi:hypothetical protein